MWVWQLSWREPVAQVLYEAVDCCLGLEANMAHGACHI